MNIRAATGLLLSTLTACTTINVTEQDAFDRKRTVNLDGLRARNVDVQSRRLRMADGVHLDLRYFSPPDAKGTVLFFGGNGFLMVTAHDLVEALLNLDLSVVMYDYRGYGQSEGEPSVAALKSDALAVYDFASTQWDIRPERLLIHGHSMGTLAATWVASERRAAGVILESPVTDVEDLLDKLTPWLVDIFVSFEIDPALRAEKNGPRVALLNTAPLLMVGEDDKVTPVTMAEELHALAPEGTRLEIIPGRGHNDLPKDEAYGRAYRSYVERVLFAGDSGAQKTVRSSP